MMNYTIRLATKKDMPKVLELIKELALFEHELDKVKITINQLENDGFGERPKFTCFVAEVKNKIEGMAFVYKRYSTWIGDSLHLEDLIVGKAMRGSGLGTALLDQVVLYGQKLDVKRISWEVLDWNEPAIKFYEKKGANVMRDWDVVQLDEHGIRNYLDTIN